jgi:hypothetical protein
MKACGRRDEQGANEQEIGDGCRGGTCINQRRKISSTRPRKWGGAFTSIVLSLIIGAGTGILGIVEVGVGVVIIVDRFAAGARCALPSSSVDLA